jgi:hypothetical protein
LRARPLAMRMENSTCRCSQACSLALLYTVQKKNYAPYRHKYHKGKITSATLLHQKINFPAKKHTFEIALTIYILGYDCEDTVKIL